MQHIPRGQGKQDASDRLIDSAEIIRRLDNLWLTQPNAVDAPYRNEVGTTVGRYILERIIGRGAFGIVYKAYDPDLDRAVAVKIPLLLDRDRLTRFEREVQVSARLDHPGIVQLYEADLSRAVPYMASAYCAGPNLQQWMEEFGVPCGIDAAVALIEKVAQAVHYAHQHGVVHRDLKPGNILLVPKEPHPSELTTLDDFEPRLTDFGLALFATGIHESQSSLIIGTPLYMSPEQAESRSEDVGPGSDVFALGAILYHLLTGVAPFAASTYAAVLLRLREENLVPITKLRSDVDADLETVCLKCLQRDPADRYSSAAAVAEDLRRCLKGQPILGRRMSFVQQIRRWSYQSDRIYEASMLIITLSSIRLLFGPGALIMAVASQDVSVTRREIVEILLANGLLILPNDIWMIWAAKQNMMNRKAVRLYYAALVLSSAGCVAMILISMGTLHAAEWYRRSIGARILVFALMSMIFFAQTLAWYIADWERHKHGPTTVLRRTIKRILIGIPVLVAITIPCVRYLSRPTEPTPLIGPAESIRLDGIDDFLTVENFSFTPDSPLTLEAWILPDKPHRGVIASHGPIALTVIAAGDGNRLRVHVLVSEDRVYMLDAEAVFGLNRWTHVAMTYQGGEIRLYVNGQLKQYDVSVYDTRTNSVTSNAGLPQPLVIADLWPGSRFLIGNLIQSDKEANFNFSGRIGEIRVTRSLFYHEEFEPLPSLKVVPKTALLFHLRDGQVQYLDVTGRFQAMLHGKNVE